MLSVLEELREKLQNIIDDKDLKIHGFDFSDLEKALSKQKEIKFKYERRRRGKYYDFAVTVDFDLLKLNIDFTTDRKNFNVYQSDLVYAGLRSEWYRGRGGRCFIEDCNSPDCNGVLSDIVELIVDAC